MRIFAVLGLLLLAVQTAVAQNFPSPSTWVNQRGSTLTIDQIGADGRFTGDYINNANGFDCKGIEYPIVGQVINGTVAFSVTWANATKDCHSITLWNGTFSASEMDTTWILAYVNPDWNLTSLAGSDQFTPKP